MLEIDVDVYVEGVSEMPYFWGRPADGPSGVAALEAQAIAARSYAVSRQIARGDPEDTNCWCDVLDTSSDQRYVGWGHTGLGHEAWLAAARATAGVVLTHPSIGGGTRPITAYYGSSSYGITESGLDGLAQDIPYLQSVDDRWALDPAVRNPYSTWTTTLAGTEIADRIGLVDRTIRSAEVSACSEAGAACRSGSWTTRAPLICAPPATSAPSSGSAPRRSRLSTASPRVPDPGHRPHWICSVIRTSGFARVRRAGPMPWATATSRSNAARPSRSSRPSATYGDHEVTGVQAEFRTQDPHLELLHNRSSTFADIAPGETSVNDDDWDVRLAAVVPDRHDAEFELVVTTDSGSTVLTYPFRTFCEGVAFGHALQIPLHGVLIDDGVNGDSVGNNDGIAQCGETIELTVRLRSLIATRLGDVSAELTSDDPRLRLVHNTTSAYPSIPGGGVKKNLDNWDVLISDELAPGHIAILQLIVTTPDDEFRLTFGFEIGCFAADPWLTRMPIDDGPTGDSIGNGDGIAQCGETIELALRLSNFADKPVRDITETFVPVDPALTLLHNAESPYPDLIADSGAFNINDWDLAIGPVPDGHEARFTLSVGYGGDREVRYHESLSIECGKEPPVFATSTIIDDGSTATASETTTNRHSVASSSSSTSSWRTHRVPTSMGSMPRSPPTTRT